MLNYNTYCIQTLPRSGYGFASATRQLSYGWKTLGVQLTRSMDNFRFDFKFVLGTVLGSFLGLILGFRRPTNFLYGARALLHGARF